MIPSYNTDLTGEYNLNLAKKRVVNKMKKTYSEYPTEYMTSELLMETNKIDSTINNVYQLLDKLINIFNEMIDSVVTNGNKSEFKSEDDYFIVLSYLRTLSTEDVPKLTRYLDFLFSSLHVIKISDFNKISSELSEFLNLYHIFYAMNINDLSNTDLYDVFKFLENETTHLLQGVVGSGRPRKVVGETEEEYKERLRVANREAQRRYRERLKQAEEPEESEEEAEEEEQSEEEEQAEEQTEEESDEGIIRPSRRRTQSTPRRSDPSNFDYVIDRRALLQYWKALIKLIEGTNGIETKWEIIKRTYNETRPSYKLDPLSSVEMVGGYDANKPYIPNKYV